VAVAVAAVAVEVAVHGGNQVVVVVKVPGGIAVNRSHMNSSVYSSGS
jgi:hypothetical protein